MDRDDVHTLEVTRQRLAVLLKSIDQLRHQVQFSNPMLSYESLQQQVSNIMSQFEGALSHLNRKSGFFASAVSYPTPAFRTLDHAGPITQMLGTKLSADVEAWVDEGGKLGRRVDAAAEDDVEGLGHKELDDIWGWAAREAVGVSEDTPFGIDFTLAERDSDDGPDGVKIGIKRELNDGMMEVDDEGEEVMGEKMDTSFTQAESPERAPMPLEDVLRFMNTGQMPPAAR